MKRSDITSKLSQMVEDKISNHYDTRRYWAKEVTFDYGTTHPVRVDYMLFKPLNNSVSGIEKGDFIAYEIKSSVDDYKSGHGLNFVGDYNYLVMPKPVYRELKDTLPLKVGVYVPEKGELKVIKSAARMDREKPATLMLLMMFRSARRDVLKTRKERENDSQ